MRRFFGSIVRQLNDDTDHFPLPHWTTILAAKELGDSSQAREAMRFLCETYYRPVFRFKEEYRQKDKEADFHILKPWLTGEANREGAIQTLDVSPEYLKVPVSRRLKSEY